MCVHMVRNIDRNGAQWCVPCICVRARGACVQCVCMCACTWCMFTIHIAQYVSCICFFRSTLCAQGSVAFFVFMAQQGWNTARWTWGGGDRWRNWGRRPASAGSTAQTGAGSTARTGAGSTAQNKGTGERHEGGWSTGEGQWRENPLDHGLHISCRVGRQTSKPRMWRQARPRQDSTRCSDPQDEAQSENGGSSASPPARGHQ